MSGLVRSTIKSIQRGTASALANVTINVAISAVNMNKTVVNNLGFTLDANPGTADLPLKFTLTSSTNLQIQPNLVGANGATTRSVSWEVIEYY